MTKYRRGACQEKGGEGYSSLYRGVCAPLKPAELLQTLAPQPAELGVQSPVSQTLHHSNCTTTTLPSD